MSKRGPLPETFRIRLTMTSDWHVGSGMGRPGNIDRLIIRDSDGLPFVPAKTLRGIWRDACERLCHGLDDGQLDEWSRLVDQLFGSQPALGLKDPTGRHSDPAQAPLESTVQIRSARIPCRLRNQLGRANPQIRQAMTFVKPGVKIDRRSGSAQADYLRFEEVARKGTILEAECQLQVSESMRETAGALLIASAKLVERLGGNRRRGLGCCRLEVLDVDANKAIAWLERNQSPPEWLPREEAATSSDSLFAAAQDDPWCSVPLVLTLQGPLAISYRTTGNVVETLDFVPGSYLLPYVSRTLRGLGIDVHAAIGAGDVCVLPAYPEVDGEHGQPVPFALFSPKVGKELEEREKVINQLLRPIPDEPQYKQLRGGYLSANPVKAYTPPITVQTHNTVHDASQRPASESGGGVYSYEAIAPSDHGKPVILRSELHLRKSITERLPPDWWTKLEGDLSLGRSKKDDYGSVTLKTGKLKPFESHAEADGQELFVWLVSDMLIRNNRLRAQPTASCLGEELSRLLGVSVSLRESSDGKLDELIRIRRLDTWHVGWGLPRPSFISLQAGSCMVFLVDGVIDPTKLHQLEASGIGERTAEGYGQVRFNHPLVTTKPEDWPFRSESLEAVFTQENVESIPSNDPNFHFARLLERECWKLEIRRACLTFAASASNRRTKLGWETGDGHGRPPMSQLGGLRGQLALLRSTADRQQVIDWLDHLANNLRRRDKWPSIPKVKAFIENDARVWEIIDTTNRPALTVDAQSELKQELWPLAVRTFFDACIRAHKRELEPPQERTEAIRGS